MEDRLVKGASAGVGVGTAHISPDGKFVSADQCLRDLLGIGSTDLHGISFASLFEPATAEDRAQHNRLLAGEIPYYASHGSVLHHDGAKIPVRMVFTRDGDHDASLLVIIEDLTLLQSANAALGEAETARRELARRLTTAQEKERTRIARELHDDIGQSLAILRIQMLRAGRPVSGMIGKRHPTIPELCDTLKALTEKVSGLSHRLHSSELEYVGLAVAIQSHCREFSQQYKMTVECTCENVPDDMDGLLALSILRIVQEALHNAGKHSQAKSIQVAVQGTASELSLLIADDGIGFDLETAKLAAGLGLISMRERVYLAGGEFKITSQPGEGTCIAARIPLATSAQESATTDGS